MSECKYESAVTKVAASAAQIYALFSHLRNLERVRDMIPQDKVQELEIDDDYVRMKVDGLGQKITVLVVDKTENEVIKYGIEGIPMQMNFWIQMKEVAPMDTRIRLTLKADIPMMFKLMLDKKIQQGIDQAATMIAQFPFAQWA